MKSVFILLMLSAVVGVANEGPKKVNIKYKKAADLDFDKMLIEGELKRPDVGIVTGDADERFNMLLRLRTDFVDKMAIGLGESVP